MTRAIAYSVSYYCASERYWHFVGDFTKKGSERRLAELKAQGYKARSRQIRIWKQRLPALSD